MYGTGKQITELGEIFVLMKEFRYSHGRQVNDVWQHKRGHGRGYLSWRGLRWSCVMNEFLIHLRKYK